MTRAFLAACLFVFAGCERPEARPVFQRVVVSELDRGELVQVQVPPRGGTLSETVALDHYSYQTPEGEVECGLSGAREETGGVYVHVWCLLSGQPTYPNAGVFFSCATEDTAQTLLLHNLGQMDQHLTVRCMP